MQVKQLELWNFKNRKTFDIVDICSHRVVTYSPLFLLELTLHLVDSLSGQFLLLAADLFKIHSSSHDEYRA